MKQRRRSPQKVRAVEPRGPFVWLATACAVFLFIVALLWAAEILPTVTAEALAGFAVAGVALFMFLTPGIQRRLARWWDRRTWERWRR